MADHELADVVVVIQHPFGDVEIPLGEWMARGPGPRVLVHPVAAKSRSTGDALPLEVIPVAYRNDTESRRLILEGVIESPWPGLGRPSAQYPYIWTADPGNGFW
jgi:hypothetical protein